MSTEKHDLMARAGREIADRGFAQEEFDTQDAVTQDAVSHHLVVVSPVLLRNIGQNDLAAEFERIVGDRSHLIWIRTNSDGNTRAMRYAPQGYPGETSVGNSFDVFRRFVEAGES